ncbi:MAG: elongation factor G, partial [Clostridia bacterium]
EENADYYKAFDGLREAFGVSVCPIVIPAIVDGKTIGIIDVVTLKGYELKNDCAIEMPIPDCMKERVSDVRARIAESVAETSEEYMTKYFSDEEFTTEEYIHGINVGLMDGTLTPVFCGSAITGIGSLALLRGLIDYAPSPLDVAPEVATDGDGEPIELAADAAAPAAALVFKTVSDQYGKFSFFKVVAGTVRGDMALTNARTGLPEKMGHLYYVCGKKHIDTTEVSLGDIGAVSKLTATKTGDTLAAAARVVTLDGIEFPKPNYSLAIMPKIKGGEEKIAAGLARMAEEDLTFSAHNDNETHQYIVTGYGDMHIDVLCARLRSRFGAEVT